LALAPCSGAQSRGNHQEGHQSRDERKEPVGLSYSDAHYSPTWSRYLVMRRHTREYGEATHSVISLSMLGLGRMEKYRRTMLASPVRSPEGWNRPPADTPLQPRSSYELSGSRK